MYALIRPRASCWHKRANEFTSVPLDLKRVCRWFFITLLQVIVFEYAAGTSSLTTPHTL
jgi:hypothetical protein